MDQKLSWGRNISQIKKYSMTSKLENSLSATLLGKSDCHVPSIFSHFQIWVTFTITLPLYLYCMFSILINRSHIWEAVTAYDLKAQDSRLRVWCHSLIKYLGMFGSICVFFMLGEMNQLGKITVDSCIHMYTLPYVHTFGGSLAHWLWYDVSSDFLS